MVSGVCHNYWYPHQRIEHKKKDTTFVVSFFSGGGGGSRTPVRKRFLGNLSGRRRSFTFPYPGVGRQTTGLGSFIVHGALKALRTHGPHSNDAPIRLVGLPVGTVAG